MKVLPGDLRDPRVVAMLDAHAGTARAQTAEGSSHALDLDGFQAPNVQLWTVWDDNDLLGVGALKRLSPDLGELKSMYTAPHARRRGVAGNMLRHIIATARANGVSRLNLETGSWAYFAPALAFYRRHGFVECPPFADYGPDPNSVFMTLDLSSHA